MENMEWCQWGRLQQEFQNEKQFCRHPGKEERIYLHGNAVGGTWGEVNEGEEGTSISLNIRKAAQSHRPI